uniref:Uncharacterized protein n=1 Tax=Arundo donax TaxID=35708 RepID=A0A0A9HD53_ARUDO
MTRELKYLAVRFQRKCSSGTYTPH